MSEELFVHKLFPALRDDRPDPFPHCEKLVSGFEEQMFVEQTVVEQCASLLPVAGNHAKENAAFSSGRGDFHGIVEGLWKVILEEPVAGLAQPGLAALFVELQVKLCLFVRRFCFHDHSPFRVAGYELIAFVGSSEISSAIHQDLKSPVDHTLAVKGHVFRIHHLCQTRVFHHLGVDAISVRSRFEDDEREENCFARFDLHQEWERHAELHFKIVTNALLVVKRAVISPYLAGRFSHADVYSNIFLRYWYHIAVHITHRISSVFVVRTNSAMGRVSATARREGKALPRPTRQEGLS